MNLLRFIFIGCSFLILFTSINVYGDQDCLRAREWLHKAEKTQNANIEQAKFYSNRAIELCPDLVEAYIELAKSFALDKEPDKVIDICKNGLKIDPYSYDLHLYLGRSYFNLLRFKESKAVYEKVIELNPKGDVGYRNLGFVNFQINDFQAAISAFEKANSILKGPSNFFWLSRSWAKKGDYKSALDYAQLCENLYPADSACLRALAFIYSQSDNREYQDGRKAMEYAKKAEKAGGGSLLVAYSYARSNNFPSAIKTIETILKSEMSKNKLLPIENRDVQLFDFILRQYKKGMAPTDSDITAWIR